MTEHTGKPRKRLLYGRQHGHKLRPRQQRLMKELLPEKYEHYYVPEQSPWPIVGAVALFFIAVGAALTVMDMGKVPW